MRILMIAHTFTPESHGGGVENHVLHASSSLVGKGHEVGVFYRIHAPGKREYELIDGQKKNIQVFKVVHSFTSSMPNPYSFYDRQVEERFLTVLERYVPDLVHIHHLGGLSTSLVGAAKRRGLPVLWTLHDFWPMCPMSHLLTPDGRLCQGPDGGMRCVECLWLRSRHDYRPVSMRARLQEIGLRGALKRVPGFIRDFVAARMGCRDPLLDVLLALPSRNDHMRHVLLTADLLISPSQFLIERFEEWGVPRSKFHYLRNGVPASLLSAGLTTSAPPPRRFTFGFVGSLYPYKGVHVLIDAFLRAQPLDAMLRIWGGPPAPEFQNYVASIHEKADNATNITLEGRFPPERLANVLRQIDVLVMPSVLYENNPLAILEAFAMRVPVIAGNAGGMAELVHDDENGLLFRVGDPVDLADKMRMIMNPERLKRHRAGIHPPPSVEETVAELEHAYNRFVK
jgi:glycosyltransferase involved in cell wall biosynthesis